MVGEPKSVSTVESGDNMATLPVSKAHTSSGDSIEKNNAANKEMELKNVMPNPSQRLDVALKNLFKFFIGSNLSKHIHNHSFRILLFSLKGC